MTRRHFQAVADVLRASGAHPDAVRDIALALADVFAADNPRFDEERFLTACGVTA
jgi:hypothetical protein